MHVSLTAAGVVFIALFAGCSRPDSPTSPATRAGDIATTRAAVQEVTFKGTLDATADITFYPPPATFFDVLLQGSGTASHLGRFTLVAPHRVDTNTGGAAGTFTITAANGDRLTGDFTGASTPIELPNLFAIVETARITGGTGRFTGATGGFIMKRVVDLSSPFTSGTFEGTISSPASMR